MGSYVGGSNWYMEQQLLPSRWAVKSLGDGLMIEFTSPQDCMNRISAHLFADHANQRGTGAAAACAQVPTLHRLSPITTIFTARCQPGGAAHHAVRPGELVTSAELRDELTEDWTPTLKTGRLSPQACACARSRLPRGPRSAAPAVRSLSEVAVELRPTVAVIRLKRAAMARAFRIGELIAEASLHNRPARRTARDLPPVHHSISRARKRMTIQDRLDALRAVRQLRGEWQQDLITAELATPATTR